jgi:hypothetical protein
MTYNPKHTNGRRKMRAPYASQRLVRKDNRKSRRKDATTARQMNRKRDRKHMTT